MSSPHWNHIPRVNMYVLQGENLRFKSTVITCVTTVSKLHVSWKWPGLHDGPCYDWFAYALWNMSRCVGTAQNSSGTLWHFRTIVGAYSSGLLYWQWLEQACISCVPLFITSRHPHNDGLVQERRNSSALAMELRLSCTNPLIYMTFNSWCCAISEKNRTTVPISDGKPSGTSIHGKWLRFCRRHVLTRCCDNYVIFRRVAMWPA